MRGEWIDRACGIAGAVLVLLALLIAVFGRPCATEDSAHCTWYGSVQGNQTGRTVVNW
jgi:hypothetical protein